MEVDAGEPSRVAAEQSAAQAATKIAPILWNGPDVDAKKKTEEELAAAAERHKKRAAKFGTEYHEPKAELYVPPEERKKVVVKRHGFATGIDLMSEEEKRKREARAKKFNIAVVEVRAEDPELAKRRVRAQKFGTVAVEEFMDVEALAEPRRDWELSVPRTWQALHVYGTDAMSTRDVMDYFQEFGPSWVSWINDSACNVVFEDRFSAKRALLGKTTCALPIPLDTPPPAPAASPPAADAAPSDEMAAEATGPAAAAENTVEECCWRQGFDGDKGNKLLLRVATKLDVKPPVRERKPSLWSRVPALRAAAEEPGYNPAAYAAEQERAEKRRAKRQRKQEKWLAKKQKREAGGAGGEEGEVAPGSPVSDAGLGGGGGGEGPGEEGEAAGDFVEAPPPEVPAEEAPAP